MRCSFPSETLCIVKIPKRPDMSVCKHFNERVCNFFLTALISLKCCFYLWHVSPMSLSILPKVWSIKAALSSWLTNLAILCTDENTSNSWGFNIDTMLRPSCQDAHRFCFFKNYFITGIHYTQLCNRAFLPTLPPIWEIHAPCFHLLLNRAQSWVLFTYQTWWICALLRPCLW